MRNLFSLLWKNQFIVLFIILEFFSLVLLTKSYSYHGSIAYNTTSNITGNLFSSVTSFTDYLDLKTENEVLAEENAILKNLLISSYITTDTNYVFRDTNFRYQQAKVVFNSNNKANNFIMVNKGQKHGVTPETGVISPLGLVGIVVGTSENFSTIMSMLHSEMRISARIKNSNQLVNVIWGQKNYQQGTVIDIPSHIRLNFGDTIVTSGNSLIFPEGIVIGTIAEHQPDQNKNLSNAVLEFSTDFNSLGHIYLIENIQKPEQDSLIEQTITNEK